MSFDKRSFAEHTSLPQPKLQKNDQRFCVDCGNFCHAISSSHVGHHIRSTKELHQDVKERLAVNKIDLEKRIYFSLSTQYKLRKIAMEQELNFSMMKTEIDKHEAKLVKEIKNIINKLQKDCTDVYQKQKKRLDALTSTIEDHICHLRKTLKATEGLEELDLPEMLIQSKHISEFIHNTDTPNIQLPIESLKFSAPSSLEYSVNLKKICGALKETFLTSDVSLKITNTCFVDCASVSEIVHVKNDAYCIHDDYKSELQMIKLEDEVKIISHQDSISVIDMASFDNGDVLFSTENNPALKIMNINGHISDYYNIPRAVGSKQHVPIGLQILEEGHIVMGTKEKGRSKFSVSSKDNRKVVVLNSCLTFTRIEFELDEAGNRLFTYPYRLAYRKNDNINVLDQLSSKTGRIVTVNKQGRILWTYYASNLPKLFNPRNLKITQSENIVISDTGNHLIHILDVSGQLISLYNVLEHGIEYPLGLSFSPTGSLIIGCSQYQGKLLYITKLSGPLSDII